MESFQRRLLGLYRHAPLKTRFFLELRARQTPYRDLAALAPKTGNILDLGCGHGLLSLSLALDSSTREIQGVDHDAARIEIARTAGEGIQNLNFRCGRLEAELQGEWDGIMLIDSLHYVPVEQQNKLLMSISSALKPGGVFLLREVDSASGISSKTNWLHEKIFNRFGITRGDGVYLQTKEKIKTALLVAGFHVIVQPMGSLIFSDVLFRCEKPNK